MTSTRSDPRRTLTLIGWVGGIIVSAVVIVIVLQQGSNQEKDPRCLNIQNSINSATQDYLSGPGYPDSNADRITLSNRMDSLSARGCTDQTATYVSIARIYAATQLGDYADVLQQTQHLLKTDTSYQRLSQPLRSKREAKARAYRASAFMALGDTIEAALSYQRVQNLRGYFTNDLHRIQIDIYAHEAYVAIGDSSYLAIAEVVLIEAFRQLKDMQADSGPIPYVNNLLGQVTDKLNKLYTEHRDFFFPVQYFQQTQEQASLVPVLYASNIVVLCITLVCLGILVMKSKRRKREPALRLVEKSPRNNNH